MTTSNTISRSPNPFYDVDDDASTVILTPSIARLEKTAAEALMALANSDARSISDGSVQEEQLGDSGFTNESEESIEEGIEESTGESSDDDRKMDYGDDGPTGYYECRTGDTLAGWTYSQHPGSICLTPPRAWLETPCEINAQWYKRPLFYSREHGGYFMSDAQCFVDKVEELGALYHQERVWGDAN